MAKKSLSELKQAAMPAVIHPELVGFARSNSPTQASQLAKNNRWPERQRKACLALAQLRRDYGEDAFDAFIIEHARSATAETELVHKPKVVTTMEDDQKVRLIQLASQAKTLMFQVQTLLRHKCYDKVVALVMQCLETGTVLFWENSTQALGIDGEKKDIHAPILVFRTLPYQGSDKELVHDKGDVCRLDFNEFNTLLNESQRQAICKKVLEAMKSFKGFFWFFEGLCSVVDTIGTEEQKREALWMYLKHRAQSKEFARMGLRLGLKKESFSDSLPLVEKLLNDLGKTQNEICDIFDSWIALVAWSHDLPVLQEAKCWKQAGRLPKKYPVTDTRFKYAWKSALSSIKWEEMEGFLKSGLFEVSSEWFIAECAAQLALGKVSLVKGLLGRFKHHFDCRNLAIDDLAFEAFNIANEAGPEYRGIAAAISQQFAIVTTDTKVFDNAKQEVFAELEAAYPWSLDIHSHDDFEARIRERFSNEQVDEPYDFDVAKVNAKMEAVERKYRELATAAKETRKQQIALAVQDALLLGQPIRLEI